MTTLNPNGNPISVGRVTLRTPGLMGNATELPAQATPGTRSRQVTTAALEQALSSSGLQAQHIIEISGTQEVPAPAGPSRSTTYGEPALVVEVPDAGRNWGQVLLYTDESGVITWNFARASDNTIDTARGQTTRTYVIPRYVPRQPPPGTAQNRGLAGALGSKVLKVLVFPLLEKGIEMVGDYFVGKWERANRPYRVRWFTPENYRSGDVPMLDPSDWQKLSQGSALLMVHGTMSQAHTGFGDLPADFVSRLNSAYNGRVFAFDQVTLSQDPSQNIDWLLSQIPDNTSLNLDIICHSRGGLVSRVLVDRQAALAGGSKQVQVNNVVFVAAPNAGTALADAQHVGDYVDTVTNLLSFVPTIGIVDVLQVVITVVKQIAVGAFQGLNGLESMRPNGDFLTKLNAEPGPTPKYFALASDYVPSDPGLQAWVTSRLLNRIFSAKNDLIVPTAGVYDQNGNHSFPITNRHIFEPADGVSHSQYFGNPTARDKIAEWLLKQPAQLQPQGAGKVDPTG